MATRKVSFKRVRSTGTTVNLWVYGPNGFKVKLRFKSDKAEADLEQGVAYQLYWIIHGPVGGTLAVTRKIDGVDADYAPLLPEWTIPADPELPPGWDVTWNDFIEFTL